MYKALTALGIEFFWSASELIIEGGLKSNPAKINLEASGTCLRFLKALSILYPAKMDFFGSKRLMSRPTKPLENALVQIKEGNHEIMIDASESSQYISALLMIAPALPKGLKIELIGHVVSKPYIQMTIEVMKAFGVNVDSPNNHTYLIKPQKYRPTTYQIEPDASAATYFKVINHLHDGDIRFESQAANSIQGDTGFQKVLGKLNETSAVNMSDMPDASLSLLIAALFKKSDTVITGLSTLKNKESNRLKAMQNELAKLAVKIEVEPDAVTIKGGQLTSEIVNQKSVMIETYDDHRLAMCFAVLGTKIAGLKISNPKCVNKTYPDFWKMLELIYPSNIELDSKNLVLIGMRSVGKSKYGKKIARKLNRKFIDLDKAIEVEQGISIPELVEKEGWEYFRLIEQKMCSKIMNENKHPIVLATGGGVVTSGQAMKILKKDSVTILLYAQPSRIASRLKANSQNRPSLTGQPISHEVLKVWEERRHLYLKYADYTITQASLNNLTLN